MERTVMPSRRAARACAQWLVTCKRLGWREQDLDALERVWWAYHDPQTGVLREPGVGVINTDAADWDAR
jgi:hypothetical protein